MQQWKIELIIAQPPQRQGQLAHTLTPDDIRYLDDVWEFNLKAPSKERVSVKEAAGRTGLAEIRVQVSTTRKPSRKD